MIWANLERWSKGVEVQFQQGFNSSFWYGENQNSWPAAAVGNSRRCGVYSTKSAVANVYVVDCFRVRWSDSDQLTNSKQCHCHTPLVWTYATGASSSYFANLQGDLAPAEFDPLFHPSSSLAVLLPLLPKALWKAKTSGYSHAVRPMKIKSTHNSRENLSDAVKAIFSPRIAIKSVSRSYKSQTVFPLLNSKLRVFPVLTNLRLIFHFQIQNKTVFPVLINPRLYFHS